MILISSFTTLRHCVSRVNDTFPARIKVGAVKKIYVRISIHICRVFREETDKLLECNLEFILSKKFHAHHRSIRLSYRQFY